MDEVGLFMERRAMRRGALVLIFGLSAACGGTVVGRSGSGDGTKDSSAGSGDSSVSGSGSGSGSSVSCTPPTTGCQMCNGEWSCSFSLGVFATCKSQPASCEDGGLVSCVLCGGNGMGNLYECPGGGDFIVVSVPCVQ